MSFQNSLIAGCHPSVTHTVAKGPFSHCVGGAKPSPYFQSLTQDTLEMAGLGTKTT